MVTTVIALSWHILHPGFFVLTYYHPSNKGENIYLKHGAGAKNVIFFRCCCHPVVSDCELFFGVFFGHCSCSHWTWQQEAAQSCQFVAESGFFFFIFWFYTLQLWFLTLSRCPLPTFFSKAICTYDFFPPVLLFKCVIKTATLPLMPQLEEFTVQLLSWWFATASSSTL